MKLQWQGPPALIFKNNFGKRQIPAVRNGEGNILHAQLVRDSFRCAFQTQGWFPARLSYHFDIAPANASSPARSQGFHHCLFGCETARIALEFISVALAIRHLAGSVQTFENGRPVPQDGRLDPVNFGNVQSQPDYQFVPLLRRGPTQLNELVMRTCMNSRLYL